MNYKAVARTDVFASTNNCGRAVTARRYLERC